MSGVKRYDAVHLRYEDSNIRYGEGCEVEVVAAYDYARLEQECERLRNAPCECGAPVGYVSGEKFQAEHERLRECRAQRDAALRQADGLRAHLKLLLNGESGRWLLAKLDDGQGTELEDGKAWLAAREAISNPDHIPDSTKMVDTPPRK